MIQKRMTKALDKDFEKFDFFNDAIDTLDWLLNFINEVEDAEERKRLEVIYERLDKLYENWLEKRYEKYHQNKINSGDE